MACFQNPMMEENGSFQVRAEGSTRGRVELRPRAGAVPKPFENTPSPETAQSYHCRESLGFCELEPKLTKET